MKDWTWPDAGDGGTVHSILVAHKHYSGPVPVELRKGDRVTFGVTADDRAIVTVRAANGRYRRRAVWSLVDVTLKP